MDSFFETFLSWQFILFSLSVAGVMFVVRKIIEVKFYKWEKTSKLWHDLMLPIMPMIIGSVGGWLVTSYPYPQDLNETGGRVAFGLVSGLMSGLFYRIVKAILAQKFPDLSLEKQKNNFQVQNYQALVKEISDLEREIIDADDPKDISRLKARLKLAKRDMSKNKDIIL